MAGARRIKTIKVLLTEGEIEKLVRAFELDERPHHELSRGEKVELAKTSRWAMRELNLWLGRSVQKVEVQDE